MKFAIIIYILGVKDMRRNILITLCLIIMILILSNGILLAADEMIYNDYLNSRKKLKNYKAVIYNVIEKERSINLHFLNGEKGKYRLADNSTTFIDNIKSNMKSLRSGDFVIISFNSESEIKFIKKVQHTNQNYTSLKDLGYSDDIIKSSSNITQDIYFPFTDNMSKEGLQLVINIKYSKFIESNSLITIKAEDKNIYSNSISNIKKELISEGIYQSQIVIDLSRFITEKDLVDNLINISILGDLNTPLNRCEEVKSNSFFFNIENSSYLKSKNNIFYDYNISDYLNYNFDKFNIYMSENFNEKSAEAYLKLRLFLERNYRDVDKKLFYTSNMKKNQMTSENFKTANIFIINNDDEITLDKNFNLSIGSKAMDSFISKTRDLYLNDIGKIKQFRIKSDNERKLSFIDLGYNSLAFNGIGEMGESISFTSADLGFNPEELTLYLNSKYTPPTKVERYEKNNTYLKIYYNGQLIRVHQLDYSGQIKNLHVELPRYLLEQENNLRFVYSYYPMGGDCSANGQDFEGVISADSYLDIEGEKTDDITTFNNLLTNYYNRGKIILGADKKKVSLRHSAKALSSFRKLDSKPLEIAVEFLNNDKKLEVDDSFEWGFAVLPNMKDYNIQKKIKIDTGKLKIQDNESGLLFEGNTAQSFSIWLLDKSNGIPFSLITTSNMSEAALNSLDQLTGKTNKLEYYRTLNGSLLLSNGGNLKDFSLDEYKIVKFNESNPFIQIYKEYKPYIFLVSLIIILIISYIIYSKLAKKPGDK